MHLQGNPDTEHYQWFSGKGQDYSLLCGECRASIGVSDVEFVEVDSDRFAIIEDEGFWDGIIGTPELNEDLGLVEVSDREIAIDELRCEDVIAAQPVDGVDGSTWIVCTRGGIHRIDLDRGQVRATCGLDGVSLDDPASVILRVSKDGRYAALAGVFAQYGQVFDLHSGKIIKDIDRGAYHQNVTPFSIAFVEYLGMQLLVHATSWNRLDITNLDTGMPVTERPSPEYQRGESRSDHYLDYFHGRLFVSPDQRSILDDGWAWHPVGMISTWNLETWIADNKWESEDGLSRRRLNYRYYYWGGPVCWVDDRHVAIWGYGRDDDWLLPGVEIMDTFSGKRVRWIYGVAADAGQTKWPDKMATEGLLHSDGSHLFGISRTKEKLDVWDLSTGTKRGEVQGLVPLAYHRRAGLFLSRGGSGRFRVTALRVTR